MTEQLRMSMIIYVKYLTMIYTQSDQCIAVVISRFFFSSFIETFLNKKIGKRDL